MNILDDDYSVVYGRTILNPEEYDRRDLTNDGVIDEKDLDLMQDARSKVMSFTEDQLVGNFKFLLIKPAVLTMRIIL